METTKTILIIDGCILAMLPIAWLIQFINDWQRDRILWNEFEARLKKQDEEFYSNLFDSLKSDPEFIKIVQGIDWSKYKEKYIPENLGWKPEPTRFERFKQWVINIF